VSVRWRGSLLAVLLLWPAVLGAQNAGVRSRLVARGLSPELVRDVVAVADEAGARGLPADAVADKAIEGWAKHVPAERIVAAVRNYAGRLGEAQAALARAGLARPAPDVTIAATEALGRGLVAEQVGDVVRAARAPAAMAPGLTVVAALAAQGLTPGDAVGVVVDAMHRGRSVDQLLDIPSMARAMRSEGVEPGDIGRRMMRGDEPGVGRGAPPGALPGGEAPGQRPPTLPAGLPGTGARLPPAGHRPPGGE